MFVADKANAQQAGTVAVVAPETLVWTWWHNAAVPPSTSFVLESCPAGVFKKWDMWDVGHHNSQLRWPIGDNQYDRHQGIF